MDIKSLKLENFRGIVDETIYFDSSLTVFAGMNGGGKSSVLEAIAIMLSWLPVRISTICCGGKKIKDTDVTFGKDLARLDMVLRTGSGHDVTLTLSKRVGGRIAAGQKDMTAAGKFGEDMRVLLDSADGVKVEIPVLAYYGADRTSMGFASPFPSSERTSIYHRAFEAGTDMKGFAKWFASMLAERESELARAREMPLKKGNELRVEIEKKFGYLYIIRNALKQFSPEFKSFSVQGGQLFVDEKKIPAALLSQGEKAVLALIADIALRMIVANPSMKNPLESDAIVLIDEIDVHLHPSWQGTVAEKIVQIFPNTQFVISTHSPTVLSLSKNAYRINPSGDRFKLERVDSQYGRNPSDILASVLDARREKTVEQKFKSLYDFIDRGKFDAAMRIIDELSDTLPDDPELMRAEYIIRAMSAKKGK